MTTTRAAIYCRVSTEDQARPDKVSLSVQRERAEAHCKAQGWEVAEVYEDAGVSGAKSADERPALSRLMKDAAEGAFGAVVILKCDRLARKTRHLLAVWDELDSLGIRLVSVSEAIDSGTPSGKMLGTMLGGIAEFERETIAERTKMGKEGQARRGQWAGSTAPYGYDFDKETKMLVINEAEAEVVRRIFSMYNKDGLSQRKIGNVLNAEGVLTKTDRACPTSVDGAKKGWWRGQISRVLTSTVYKGEAAYNKTKANPEAAKGRGALWVTRRPKDDWIRIPCPAIVSEGEFAAAAERAKRNARWGKLPADRKTEYLLSGLLRCHCGRVMYGKTVRHTVRGKTYHYRYYGCAGQANYESPCRQKSKIPARLIEDPVWASVMDAFRDPRRVLMACLAHADQLLAEEESEEGRAEDLRRKLAQTDEERDRLVALCAKGTITEGQLKRQLARLDGEVAELEEALGRVEEGKRQKQHVDDIERVARTIAGRIEQVSEAMTLEERKELLRALVERIVVAEDNALTIECGVPGVLQEEPQATARGVRPASDLHKAPQATSGGLRSSLTIGASAASPQSGAPPL